MVSGGGKKKISSHNILAVFVVELNVDTKNASGIIDAPKRKNEIKFTKKFALVKNENWNAAPEANIMRTETACTMQLVRNQESQNMLS